MKHSVLPALLIFLLCSCSGNADQSRESIDTSPDTAPNVDSSRIADDSLPQNLIAASLTEDVIAPANTDLILFQFGKELSENKSRPLTARQVQLHFMPIDPQCDAEAAWTLQRFFYLDSLQRIGEEPAHDMGQTKTVEIRIYDTIKETPEERWVVWTMYYETEQACPYATGTYYMLSTYDKNRKLVSTQCMGRDCGGADAPMQWSSSQQSNIFNDGSFRGLLSDTSGDYSEEKPDLAIMRKTFTGRIAPGGKITTVIREIERNE